MTKQERKKEYDREYKAANRAHINRVAAEWRRRNNLKSTASTRKRRERMTEAQRLLENSRASAKRKGLEFTIELEDIIVPELCPVYSVPLVPKTEYAPSLDRFNSSLGYVPGNVNVISLRANTIKNMGTVDDHEAIVRWMHDRSATDAG